MFTIKGTPPSAAIRSDIFSNRWEFRRTGEQEICIPADTGMNHLHHTIFSNKVQEVLVFLIFFYHFFRNFRFLLERVHTLHTFLLYNRFWIDENHSLSPPSKK